MLYLYLLAYGFLHFVVVYLLARHVPKQPRSFAVVSGAIAMVLVVGVGAFDIHWIENEISYGVPE